MNNEQKIEPCKKCNFDDMFIIDYDKDGKEYAFCGNCGTVKEAPAHE